MTTIDHAMEVVAQGSRILAAQEILDAFGHVSARHPARPDRFLISRSLAPALVQPEDVVELDLDGNATSGSGETRLFLERYIHGEIYRRRPDVNAVVHSHQPSVVPFTVVREAGLKPICHMCGFLQEVPRPFDVADHSGSSTDLLISNSELGRELATHLGEASVVLMRSHGYTVVGDNVQQAVFRAIYTARNCEMDLAARLLGAPTYLTAGEAAACESTTGKHTGRAWNLWLHQLGTLAPAKVERDV